MNNYCRDEWVTDGTLSQGTVCDQTRGEGSGGSMAGRPIMRSNLSK